MDANEIVQLAQNLKKKYNDLNPINICEKLNFKINYIKLKPNIYPAYTTKIGKLSIINLNKHFTLTSQCVLCAHELGHALMHGDKLINEFDDDHNGTYEYEANLFAVALLFNTEDFCMDITKMSNYLLKGILDDNIKLKSVTNQN